MTVTNTAKVILKEKVSVGRKLFELRRRLLKATSENVPNIPKAFLLLLFHSLIPTIEPFKILFSLPKGEKLIRGTNPKIQSARAGARSLCYWHTRMPPKNHGDFIVPEINQLLYSELVRSFNVSEKNLHG